MGVSLFAALFLVISEIIAIDHKFLKTRFFGYILVADNMGLASSTVT